MKGTVALAQGCYFFVTGVWPLLDIDSFQRVTGPKTDRWLVKTVGAVLAAIGAALVLAGIRDELTPSTVLLAMGNAAALACVDLVYVSKRVISPIYLLDAAAEAVLIIWWAIVILY
jgi:CBS domain containing-hemolysin-like protein